MDSLAVSSDTTSQNKPIDSGAILLEQMPSIARYPKLLRRLLLLTLQWLICERRINRFLSQHAMTRDFDFVDQVFQLVPTDCTVRHSDLENIPARGRVNFDLHGHGSGKSITYEKWRTREDSNL